MRPPLEQVGIAMTTGYPVLLIGKTGTGKTSLVRHLAFETKNAFVRVNLNGGTTVEDLVGRWLIDEKGTKWVDGILVEAMKEGYWFHADEINAASAEILFVLHSLLDDDAKITLVEKGNEVVVPHPNFRFFAAMNPMTDYAGTKEMNKALMSRFAVVNVDFCPPDVEESILVSRTGVSPEVAKNMVKLAIMARSTDKVTSPLSTRDLLMWGAMFKIYGKYIPAAETSIVNKMSDDDKEFIKTNLSALYMKADTMVAPNGKVIGIGTKVTLAKNLTTKSGKKIPAGTKGEICLDLIAFKEAKEKEGKPVQMGNYRWAVMLDTDFGTPEVSIDGMYIGVKGRTIFVEADFINVL